MSQNVSLKLSDKLQLVLLNESHARSLYDATESNRAYLRQHLTFMDNSITFEDRLDFIKSQVEAYQQKRGVTFAVFYEHQMVGLVGSHDVCHRTKSTSIGFWLIESAQGKGIMGSAAKALVHFLFTEFQINRIEMKHAESNQKSKKVIERLGAIYEGRLREAEWLYDHYEDFHVYSILKSEWKFTKSYYSFF